MNAPEAIDRYLDELAQQRRQSPHTVTNYRRDLRVLCRLLEATGKLDLLSLQPHHVRRFVAQLHGQGLSGRSLARMLSAWRGFYRWLGAHGEVSVDPFQAAGGRRREAQHRE